MVFKVTSAKWLETESSRVTAIVLMPRFWGVKWDDKSLRIALKDVGLNYSDEDIKILNDELHKQGIVEDI